jgi:hypothetical protein
VELGERIWKSFAAAAWSNALAILDGADPRSYPRYADLLEKNPRYQEWMRAAEARATKRRMAKQDAWLQSVRPATAEGREAREDRNQREEWRSGGCARSAPHMKPNSSETPILDDAR